MLVGRGRAQQRSMLVGRGRALQRSMLVGRGRALQRSMLVGRGSIEAWEAAAVLIQLQRLTLAEKGREGLQSEEGGGRVDLQHLVFAAGKRRGLREMLAGRGK